MSEEECPGRGNSLLKVAERGQSKEDTHLVGGTVRKEKQWEMRSER